MKHVSPGGDGGNSGGGGWCPMMPSVATHFRSSEIGWSHYTLK